MAPFVCASLTNFMVQRFFTCNNWTRHSIKQHCDIFSNDTYHFWNTSSNLLLSKNEPRALLLNSVTRISTQTKRGYMSPFLNWINSR